MPKHIPAKIITQLNQQARRNYIQTVFEYLEEFFPGTHDYFENKQITNTIELGIAKAESYDIRGKNDVCSFICLMFTFLGSHFDVDPLYPWAQDILSKEKSPQTPTLTATEKVERLWKKQQELSSSLFHTNSQYLSRLFQSLGNLSLLEPFGGIQSPLRTRINDRLATFYPEKYKILTPYDVRELIDEGLQICHTYNIYQEHEICWYISLMFIFGSRFDIDPKYPVYDYLKQKKSLNDGELTAQLDVFIKKYLVVNENILL